MPCSCQEVLKNIMDWCFKRCYSVSPGQSAHSYDLPCGLHCLCCDRGISCSHASMRQISTAIPPCHLALWQHCFDKDGGPAPVSKRHIISQPLLHPAHWQGDPPIFPVPSHLQLAIISIPNSVCMPERVVLVIDSSHGISHKDTACLVLCMRA